MSNLVPSSTVVVRTETGTIDHRHLSPSHRFYHMLTNHPGYQQEFEGKKLSRREVRLIDLGAMTAADLTCATQTERAQSAFWQWARLFSAGDSRNEDAKEISWISKYMTLRTILPVAVVVIGGLFTFLTWTIDHNNAEKHELYQILYDTRQDLARVSGLPEKLIKDIDELTKEAKTLQDEKDKIAGEAKSLRQKLTDSETQIAALKKQNDDMQQQLAHAHDGGTQSTTSANSQ